MIFNSEKAILTINTEREIRTPPLHVKKDGAEITLEIINEEFYAGKVTFCETGDIVAVSLDVTCKGLPYQYAYTLPCYDSVYIDIPINFEVEKVLSQELYQPYWARPQFEKRFSCLEGKIQNMLVKSGGEYINIMPLSTKNNISQIIKSEKDTFLRISVSKMYAGSKHICGDVLICSKSDNPYKSIEKSYDYAIKNGIINLNASKNKNYPEIFKYLGWCSWNAFYHNFDEEKLTAKAREFEKKNIPVRWFLIDAGWMNIRDNKLVLFNEDFNKLKSGLKGFSDKIKNKYNMKYLGVWLAMASYGYGVDKDSKLYDEQKDNLTFTNGGYYIPGGTEEKAYNFYNAWHKYLSENGVDFIKTDYQGNTVEFNKNSYNACEKVINAQNALERSARDNFGARLMNCMGQANINNFNHAYSNMGRSSDDFYPHKDDDFEYHSKENVYNSVFWGYHTRSDYDMYWSNHFDAKRGAVLRAISGGPVYVSDPLGESNAQYMVPCADEEGKILLCDNCAYPCDDCLFDDPKDKILKVYNTKDDCGVVGLFNLGYKQSAQVCAKDFCGSGEYIAYLYFAKKFVHIKNGETFTVEIEKNDCEIVNFYPVSNGKIMLGDIEKYVSAASDKKTEIKVELLIK